MLDKTNTTVRPYAQAQQTGRDYIEGLMIRNPPGRALPPLRSNLIPKALAKKALGKFQNHFSR